MTLNDLLSNSERIILTLRALYAENGYKPYRMGKFEEYDLYAKNKEFLVSDSVITFTDTDGKLMALKPDVTLSIIKNCDISSGEVKKVCYNENVYRTQEGTGSFKEIIQTGVECFGDINATDIESVILLAAKSLKALSDNCVLDISDLGVINAVVSKTGLKSSAKKALYKALGEKNTHEIAEICEKNGVSGQTGFLTELLSVDGDIKTAIAKIKTIAKNSGEKALFENLIGVLERLSVSEVADVIRLDFSVIGDVNYYNGIIFKGFINGIPNAVLSGGQYDNLLKKLKKDFKAIGFAVYVGALENADFNNAVSGKPERQTDFFLNIALPKGRLGEKVYSLFEKAGYECPSVLEHNRKLIFENTEKKVRYFWVKPSDVAIYVERGAADIGVAGKDILLEYEPDVYELLDLKAGKCKMAVAAKSDYSDDRTKTIKVATKFTRIAKNYYLSKGRDIDIIKLNGSIELAPILNLSDVIVDIVETGETLKENNLQVVETIVPISARLIANKSAMKFKESAVKGAVEKISVVIKG
ncbi:MAG: ATP phosphoribosyltransferase [Clostridia bacterium]|nr:ATP phosphoribosyltransferase [Clostridia bacterium]